MLLPSDVARLVLGYLQEEGLSATSQTFIHESPNLREYAEHTTGDGTIPACVFSIFGKGLAAILNEYVAVKAKEAGHEVPLLMASLWKKLDFTLNQIKSLQNSPVVSASQRTRSRVGLGNMTRQRVLAVASSSGVVCSSVSESSSILSPAHTPHGMLGHSTPVSYVGPQSRAAPGGVPLQPLHDGSRSLSTPRDSPVQVVISEHRLTSGPASPGRRKWDTPRKRSGATGSGAPSKTPTAPSSLTADTQPEEVVNENFPQLVIQNARDKILGDRSLQEKLAENINKILSSDGVPQTSKASSAAVEPDQSIDEILGLEGEIHMSDDAIHDILEQTESDPAFQALFDLFDYHKSKHADGEAGDGGNVNEPAGASSSVQLLQSTDPGPAERDPNVSDAAAGMPKARPGQERKTRKPAAPTLLRKTILDSSGRTSRIENSSARLLISHVEPRGPSCAAGGSRREKPSVSSGGVTQTDIDEPLNTPPPPVDSLLSQEPPSRGDTPAPDAPGPSSNAQTAEERSASDGGRNAQQQQATGPSRRTDPSPPAAGGDQRQVGSPVAAPANGDAATASCRPAAFVPGGDRLAAAPASAPSAPAASTSACAPAAARRSPPTAPVPASPSKAGEPSGIVSLKIILSDNQEGDPQGGDALNQAIPGIPSDKIPTIYLSSPIKSPGPPATPKANFDEAAQAVSGLQRSEGCGSPLVCKAGGATASAGASQAQQSYIIQLPVDTAGPGLQGPAASFFFVAPTPELQSRPVLLPAGVPSAQHAVAPPGVAPPGVAPPGVAPPGIHTGSALLLPSPVKPVVLLGQNTMGNIKVVSSQLVDVTNPKPVQPAEKVQAKPRTAAPKQSTKPGSEKNATAVQAPPPGQKDAAKASSHRRILCFHSPASEVQSQMSRTAGAPPPVAPNAHRRAAHATKPAILGGSKPKRRVETVRCPADPQGRASLVEEAVCSRARQRGPVKRTPRKQMHVVHDPGPQNANAATAPEAEQGSASSDGSPRPKDDEPTAEDACSSGPPPSRSPAPSGGRTDSGGSGRRGAGDRSPSKGRDGRTERRTSSQESPDVRANKENEGKGSSQERKPPAPSSSAAASGDPSPPAKSSKAASKTSSLAKQAAEMLQDLQGLSSPPPARKAGLGSSDLGPPGADRTHGAADVQRTPSRQKSAEGTPKRLLPPNTPDVPTCSPASEAGSENSINMAAHTLMILSRAAIARTGTPLKNSLRQEEAGDKSPASSGSKRRKRPPAGESPPAKRERRRSPGSKKDKERKKLMDGFPHDLDVDKFLSSLHYDE